MIRVLVKASSPLLQAGLEGMLGTATGMEVVGGNREDLRGRGDRRLEDPAADVMILEMEGEEDLAELAAPGAAVVLLLDEPSATAMVEALRRGVRGILPRHLGREELLAAVQAVASGLVVFHGEEMTALLPFRSSGASGIGPVEALTQRENEVLAMMAEGLANKEIASRLQISEHTVKFHVASVMGKLGATSRTEAVTAAIRRGLLFV